MQDVWIFLCERAERGESRARALACIRRYALELGLEPPRGLSEQQGGKPVVQGGGLHFSVSHSGGIWACAVHTHEVGLDVQVEGMPRGAAVARRFFCPPEIEYLRRHPQDFFKVWCAKEAAVKYSGIGIARGFSQLCVTDGQGLLDRLGGAALHHFSPEKGFFACLCAQQDAQYELIRTQAGV